MQKKYPSKGNLFVSYKKFIFFDIIQESRNEKNQLYKIKTILRPRKIKIGSLMLRYQFIYNIS